MRSLRNKKALMFTLAAALFAIALLSVILIRLEQSREHGEALTYRIRCDELSAFLNDMTLDLERASSISGKRAAVYAMDVVVNGTALGNATEYLDEMVLYGTFNGTKVTTLENQSLTNWTTRIKTLAEQRHFITNLDMDLFEIDHAPYTSWDYWVRTKIVGLELIDSYGYCSFIGTLPRQGKWINANVSVLGLEDPLYTYKARGYVSRGINPCNESMEDHDDPDIILDDIAEKLYHTSAEAPCFFERLEARLAYPFESARHDFYVDKAYNAILDTGVAINRSDVVIGMETFVDVSELLNYVPQEVQHLVIKSNQSVPAHVYFGLALNGRKMYDVTDTAYPWFRIDNNHSGIYNINESQLYD